MEILIRMASYCYGAWLGWMLEVPMAAFLARQHPSICFKPLDQLANLHLTIRYFGEV